jgi:hypothetical protein
MMPNIERLAREASLQLLKGRFAYLADEYPELLKRIEGAIDEAGGLVVERVCVARVRDRVVLHCLDVLKKVFGETRRGICGEQPMVSPIRLCLTKRSRANHLEEEKFHLLRNLETLRTRLNEQILVGAAGLEPATLCLEGKCSIHLSYAPTKKKSDQTVQTDTRSPGWQSQADGVHEDSNPNPCSACSAGDWRQEHHQHDYPPSQSACAPAGKVDPADVAFDNLGRAWSGGTRVPALDVEPRVITGGFITGVNLKPGVPRV